MKKIIIGSRGSDLALWQARYFQQELQKIGISSEIKIITTKGDQIQNLSFDKIEGKGFFTKEIEDALLSRQIDVAVHSHKDLETTEHPALTIAAVSYREDPSELMLINKNSFDVSMPLMLKPNAIVGTSSGRRKTQLLLFREDLIIKDLRGNVPTRIKKLKDQQYDSIVLAKAGVHRLQMNLSDFFVIPYDPKVFIPAPAQGVLAYQTRKEDKELIQQLQKIHHPEVKRTITVEREILRQLHGGCQLPLGVFCEEKQHQYHAYISYTQDKNSPLKRFYIRAASPKEIITKAVKKIKTSDTKKVLITRKLTNESIFKKLLDQNHYTVIEQPFISLKENKIKENITADWLFFTSKNAAKIWLKNQYSLSNTNIACIGKSTAAEFLKHQIHPVFVGNSTNHQQIAEAFLEYAEGQKVVFPASDKSNKSIQQIIEGKCQVETLELYTTNLHPQTVKDSFDVIVFTSPSNVEAFFKANCVDEKHLVVAIGERTQKKLEMYNISSIITPWEWSELALADTVLGL